MRALEELVEGGVDVGGVAGELLPSHSRWFLRATIPVARPDGPRRPLDGRQGPRIVGVGGASPTDAAALTL
jgi:hypothetical protein